MASWNVNSVGVRLERLLAFLEREKPDVVCLQELKCEESRFPGEVLKAAGYGAAVFGQRTYNGVALLAREPLEEVRRGLDDGEEDPQARLIAATLRGVRVISAYVPNGQAVGTDKYAYKLEWFRRLRRYLERWHRPSDDLVLAGDFNVAPEDRDVHDPEAWRGQVLCSEPERAGLKGVTDWGLADTFRLHHAEGGHYSWWDYRMLGFPKNRGLRIDLILATQSLRERCRFARIDRDERKGKQPSDHAPVIADFDVS